MFIGAFPNLPEDGLTVTYDRNMALARDDMHFLTWEHPMVRGAIELVLSEDKGNSCVCILRNKAIPAGTLLMEVIYHAESTAPKYLQAQRFLPYQTLRLLVDKNGNDLASKVNHQQLSLQCEKIPKHHSRQVIKSESKTLRDMLTKANQIAEKKSSELLGSIVTDMKQAQMNELNRLVSLKKKNPNIRDEEIEFINNQTHLLENYLEKSKLQLAAMRVIVAV
jgi:ATP-dependent helicase HepA